MRIKFLEPREYINQKSFYNKAIEVFDNGSVLLISYSTNIVKIHPDRTIEFLADERSLSNTTMKHLREFLYQHGFKDLAKSSRKEIIKELNGWNYL